METRPINFGDLNNSANRNFPNFFSMLLIEIRQLDIDHKQEINLESHKDAAGLKILSKLLDSSTSFEDETVVNSWSVTNLKELSPRNGETLKEVEDLLPFLVIDEGSCGSSCTIEIPDTQTSLVSRIYYWILILSAERLGPAGTSKLLEAVIVNRIPLVTLHPRRNALTELATQHDQRSLGLYITLKVPYNRFSYNRQRRLIENLCLAGVRLITIALKPVHLIVRSNFDPIDLVNKNMLRKKDKHKIYS